MYPSTALSDIKKSNQNTDKKYVSLSNILSEKSLSTKDIDNSPREQVICERKLVDLNKLLTDFNITVDEELKKIDESEKVRQKNILQTNKILESINWNYSFKNRQNSIKRYSRKNQIKKLTDLVRPKLKRKSKKIQIKIKKLSKVEDLIRFRQKLIPVNIELSANGLLRPLKNRRFRDAIKKKEKNRNVSTSFSINSYK